MSNTEALSKTLLDGQTGQALQLPPDITANVSKREHYPSAHGGFADIWDCEMKHETTRVLIRELSIWNILHHPRILPLLGTVSSFGPYLSMVCPWMTNGNLTQYLKGSGLHLSIEARYKLLAQVCDGIQYLHSFSIVHGDLTGSNVLIDADGDACISDFGLSDIFSDDLDASASASIIAGNVLTGNIPYYYVKADAQVLVELVKGVQPRRPSDVSMTDTRWNCICACWETSPPARPTLKEVGEFLKNPLLTFSHTSTEAFPDLRNVQLVEVLNSSRGVFFESWSGILTGDTQQTVAVKLIRRTSIDWRFRQLQQVAQGLSHLHSLSIVHGGLTGWNILVGRNGLVKLCNYALLPILLRHNSLDLPFIYDDDIRWADPVLWLTSRDGSPNPLPTSTHDVFSFGRVMLQLFTGRVPFHVKGRDPSEFPVDNGATPADFVPKKPSNRLVSPELWELIQACWDEDTASRPTIDEVASRLRVFRQGRKDGTTTPG
ncbi:hypothetical protein ONZ45_g5104 [Pleurotus djamor]|nr:hypothetical protein ONZ45_g5104 [Pleurotus djamor]